MEALSFPSVKHGRIPKSPRDKSSLVILSFVKSKDFNESQRSVADTEAVSNLSEAHVNLGDDGSGTLEVVDAIAPTVFPGS
jgi:hypothetical protein